MDSDRYRQRFLLQLAFLLANCFVLMWLVLSSAWYAVIVVSIVILSVQVLLIVRYLDQSNRAIARFLVTVKYDDVSQGFYREHAPESFRELGQAMEEVVAGLQKAKTEKEEQATYMRVLVQHIPVAVIAVREDGSISLFNNAARRLFGLSDMRELEQLESFDPGLTGAIAALEPGGERLVRVVQDNGLLQLNISATSLKLKGSAEKIVSIQDIQGQLENQEMEAWQNLIRVLTHEIMNSVTPITSLAQTASETVDGLIAELPAESTMREDLQDTFDALDTVGRRSAGLMRFVESYRSLTRLPTAKIRVIRLDGFLQRIETLLEESFRNQGVEFSTLVEPESLELSGDPELLEQAVINLLKNAQDAVVDAQNPQVSLTARLGTKGHIIIAVKDNGSGMGEEILNNIFVPFFTTKRHGTGVGLSLVRQIVRLHRGQVGITSETGTGTEIRLRF
jgi:nitrogen fixation/metabolism regulation signal transduction histidine kinase